MLHAKRGMGHTEKVDMVFVGAGIMSATLATLAKELDPGLSISVYERLDGMAQESSNAWNNAGTGHTALCELNYTPQKPDGSIDIWKAIRINEHFEQSKQFWSYLVRKGVLADPDKFIHPMPHMSFVRGEADVAFLKKRHEALSANPLFSNMHFSTDRGQLADWAPLTMEGRDSPEPVAATHSEFGSDVDFGALTRCLLENMSKQEGFRVHLQHQVEALERIPGGWKVLIKDLLTNEVKEVRTQFVFLGAGGYALPLLQKSGIPEGHGFGGFPVSGMWLRCDNPELVARHHAKVYGKAGVKTPPMSVPHLDMRVIDGQTSLLFGPFAGFSTRYLKKGSLLDFPASLRPNNVWPMVMAGAQNVPLTQYLIGQVLQSKGDRMAALREYMPLARDEDWHIEVAGQRVQVIKKCPRRGGILQFGTELVTAEDGSIAAMLGASPGASTAVSIMVELVEQCFDQRLAKGWQRRLREMIPSHRLSLSDDLELLKHVRRQSNELLGLRVHTYAAA